MSETRKIDLYLTGMTCANCAGRIERKLRAVAGVSEARADFSAARAVVVFDPERVGVDDLCGAVRALNYGADIEKPAAPMVKIAALIALIFALYFLARMLGADTFATGFQLADAGMNYGMIFGIGVMTSLHCIAMCGGINLSQSLSSGATGAGARLTALRPTLQYNGGRLISYTLTGAAVGAVGQVFTLTGAMQGAAQIIAGVFMALMAAKMLGILPAWLHLPRWFKRAEATVGADLNNAAARASRRPLIIGLLNGLMPCGPLQAMQLYALATGSPLKGAAAMFLFGAGTLPLMFGLGAAGSLLSRKFTTIIMRGGAVLIAVLGLLMLTSGLGLAGVSLDFFGGAAAKLPPIIDGKQIINSQLEPGAYPALTVAAGVPVRWTIEAAPENINGCNNRVIIREYGIEHTFHAGANVIEFTPERAGRVPYSCWMGMIRSAITVVEPNGAETAPTSLTEPAGVEILTEEIGVAELTGAGSQTITLTLTDEKISPAVIVAQKGLPLILRVKNESRDVGNGALLAPDLATKFLTPTGETTFNLTPEKSFIFSTADSFSFGWLEAVDDLNNFDREALKARVAAQEALIYPAEHFSRTVPDGAE